MPHSLRAKLSGLRYKGILEDKDYKRLCHALDLEKAEQEQKSGKWISVSERLPEKDGEYLLFGKIDKDEENYIFVGDYDSCGEQFGIWQEQYDRSTLGCIGSEFYEYASVIAWMPLPESYEPQESEE